MLLNRQFILPTNLGGYLNGLIFLLTMLAFGYNNNLLLIFTLMLFGMNIVWVIQSHLYFKNMRFLEISLGDAFCGQKNEVRILWNNSHFKGQWNIELIEDKKKFKVRSLKTESRTLIGEISLPHRGNFTFSRLRISSPSPFGLYQNWIILPIEAKAYVYPALQNKFIPSSENPIHLEGAYEKDPDTYQEFVDLRSSEDGLSSRISWKHYARTDEILVKHGEGSRGRIRCLKVLSHLKGEDHEKMLSHLASEAFWCSQQGLDFELRGSFRTIGPGSSPSIVKAALRELAVC
jgi:uncharacterized protein (DUF58 family)